MSTTDTTTAATDDVSRRDFIHIAATGVAGVGAAMAVWPFIDQLNPAADTLALATVEIDVSSLDEGAAMLVTWRKKPVFIRRRTASELEEMAAVPLGSLIDQDSDADRVIEGKEEFLVVVGSCTHLGCVPLGTKEGDDRGEFGGWFCPCHGSHYDVSGRIRKGPAPKNLVVPEFSFLTDTTIRIG